MEKWETVICWKKETFLYSENGGLSVYFIMERVVTALIISITSSNYHFLYLYEFN